MCVLSPKLIEHFFGGNMHSSRKNILEQNLGGTHFSVPVGGPGIYIAYMDGAGIMQKTFHGHMSCSPIMPCHHMLCPMYFVSYTQ